MYIYIYTNKDSTDGAPPPCKSFRCLYQKAQNKGTFNRKAADFGPGF